MSPPKLQPMQKNGLAIYTARGLRSGTAKIAAVAFTACGDWQFSLKNEMQKLDIFQVVSNLSLVAETAVRKKSVRLRRKHTETQIMRVECRKLCYLAFYAAIPRKNPLQNKSSGRKKS